MQEWKGDLADDNYFMGNLMETGYLYVIIMSVIVSAAHLKLNYSCSPQLLISFLLLV